MTAYCQRLQSATKTCKSFIRPLVWMMVVSMHIDMHGHPSMTNPSCDASISYALVSVVGGIGGGVIGTYVKNKREERRDFMQRRIANVRSHINNRDTADPYISLDAMPIEQAMDIKQHISELDKWKSQSYHQINQYRRLFHNTCDKVCRDIGSILDEIEGTPADGPELKVLAQQARDMDARRLQMYNERITKPHIRGVTQTACHMQRAARGVYDRFCSCGIPGDLKLKGETRYTRVNSRSELLKEYARSIEQAIDRRDEIEQIQNTWEKLYSCMSNVYNAAHTQNGVSGERDNEVNPYPGQEMKELSNTIAPHWAERYLPIGFAACGACIGCGVYALLYTVCACLGQ